MRKKRILCALSVVACAAFGGGLSFAASNAAAEPDLFDETYLYNQTIQIPDYSFDGVQATKTVRTPDGGAFRVDRLQLDAYGWYTVTYTATVNNVLKVYEEKFFVNMPKYYVEGDGAAYAYEETGYSEGDSDLVVTLTEGSAFYYDKVIDLSKATSADDIVSLYVVPGSVGSADFGYLLITFTDIYDPEVSFTVRFSSYSYEGVDGSYATVSFADQGFVGTERWNGKIYTDNYGMYNVTNFTGVVRSSAENKMYDRLFKIRYDAATKEVYSPNYIFKNGTDIWNSLVADLDNASFYDCAFSGFTTGEVRMSIRAENYKTASGKIAIVDVAGDDCGDAVLWENSKPTLTVLDSENPPFACVGKKYEIFDATAYDKEDGVVPVATRVYYGYGSTAQTRVNLKDGYFTPTKEGVYTVEYTATDRLGAAVKQVVRVRAANTSGGMELVLTGEVDSGKAGLPIELATYTVVGAEECGEVSVEIKIKDENGSVYEHEDGVFLPLAAKKYTVYYTATAQNGVACVNAYEITVAKNSAPIFLDEAVFPNYYLHGGEYVVPSLKAYSVENGIEELPVGVYYRNAGEEWLEAADRKIYPLGVYNATDSVTEIKYEAVAQNGQTTEKIYSVKTINPVSADGYDYSKFFLTENAIAVPTESGVSITTTQEGGRIAYMKELNQNMLNWAIKINPTKQAFTRLDFYLSDSVDSTQLIKLSLFKKKGTASECVAVLNDGLKQYKLGGSFGGTASLEESELISISYNVRMKQLSDLLNPAITIKKTLYGQPFDGFKSGAARLTMQVTGVSGESEVLWVSLGNQYFLGEVGADYVSPSGVFTKDCGGSYGVNERFVIPAIKTYDFLAPTVTSTVTVKTPSGAYAVSESGVTMNGVDAYTDYYVVGAEYGQYTVNYILTDTNGNTNYSLSFVVNIKDMIEPTLSLNGKCPTTAKVGDTVVLPKATAFDENGEYTLMTFVAAENGRREKLESNRFIPKTAGKYTVYYIVVDAAGNMTMQTFVLQVTA